MAADSSKCRRCWRRAPRPRLRNGLCAACRRELGLPLLEVCMGEKVDAILIAEALRPGGCGSAKRNRLIKAALVAEFGRGNVSVRGERGTAAGWVNIEIKAKKPHEGDCDWGCLMCRDARDKVEGRVWQILAETRLDRMLYTWYDDMGERHYECSIRVELT